MSNSLLDTTYLKFTQGGTDEVRATAGPSSITFTGAGGGGTAKIRGVTNPTELQDAATKSYVDNVAQGLHWLDPVKVATAVAGTLATSFASGETVDGVVLSTGDRILIKDQASGVENGLYIVTAGTPTRATDFALGDAVASNALFVSMGTINADAGFVVTNDPGSDVVGTDSLNFVIFSRSGGLAAGNNGELQYNNNGTLDGISGVKTDGTNLSLEGADLSLDDNDEIRVGTGNDLTVKHDGTKTTMVNTTGDLIIQNTDTTAATKLTMKLGTSDGNTSFRVENAAGTGLMTMQGAGATTLVGPWFEIYGGDIRVKGDSKEVSAGAANDIKIYHDGTNSYLTNDTNNLIVDNTSATGDTIFRLGADTSDTQFKVQNDSENDSFVVDGTAAQFTVPVDATAGLDINADNTALRIGASNEFSISHTAGGDTTLVNTTGNYFLDSHDVTGQIKVRTGTNDSATSFQVTKNNDEDIFRAYADGQTLMNGDSHTIGNFSRKQTVASIITAGNVNLTFDQLWGGIIKRDPLGSNRSDTFPNAVDFVTSLTQVGSSYDFIIQNTADAAETITMVAGTGITLNGTMTIEQHQTRSFTAIVTNITGSNEAVTIYDKGLSFAGAVFAGGANTEMQYNDNGALAGLSTFTTDGTNLTMDGGNIKVMDGNRFVIGNSSDVIMVHNGGNSLIESKTGDLTVDNKNHSGATIMKLGSNSNSSNFRVVNNSDSLLLGVDGSGDVTVQQGDVNVASDGARLTIGAGLSSDLYLTHDGSDSFIHSGTGDLIVANTNATGQTIMRTGSNTNATAFKVNNVTGTIFTVDGSGTVTTTGNVNIDDTTGSTSATSGALVVDGGLGVAEKIYSGNEMYAVAFNATSDATLKRDVSILENPLSKLEAIEAYQYKFNFKDDDQLRYGVTAQNLVEAGMDHLVQEQENGKLTVDYNNLVGLLIGSVKELKQRIDELEKK